MDVALLEVHLAQDQVEALREGRKQAHLVDQLDQGQVEARPVQGQPEAQLVDLQGQGLLEDLLVDQIEVLLEQGRLVAQTREVQQEEAHLNVALLKERRSLLSANLWEVMQRPEQKLLLTLIFSIRTKWKIEPLRLIGLRLH